MLEAVAMALRKKKMVMAASFNTGLILVLNVGMFKVGCIVGVFAE